MSAISEEHLKGLLTELNAGKVLLPTTAEGKAWNNATDRAIELIKDYQHGDGLFQILLDYPGEKL